MVGIFKWNRKYSLRKYRFIFVRLKNSNENTGKKTRRKQEKISKNFPPPLLGWEFSSWTMKSPWSTGILHKKKCKNQEKKSLVDWKKSSGTYKLIKLHLASKNFEILRKRILNVPKSIKCTFK